MNKDKFIDYTKERVENLKEEYKNAYKGGDAEEMAFLEGKIEETKNYMKLIQSEPEEKTNFNVITESPEKLYKFILDQYGYSQVKDGAIYINLEWWLNEKAGE
jgi:hypothetical protein